MAGVGKYKALTTTLTQQQKHMPKDTEQTQLPELTLSHFGGVEHKKRLEDAGKCVGQWLLSLPGNLGLASLSIRKPSSAAAEACSSRALRLGCNHEFEGCTRRAPAFPEAITESPVFSWHNPHLKWRVDHIRVKVGKGKMAYRKAQGALRSWQHMKLGWTDVEGAQPSQGVPACILANVAFAWVRNPVKIVYMDERRTVLQQLDEAGEGCKARGRRFTMAQSTLQGHVLAGEERFTLEWHQNDDSVWYDIHVFSRPAKPLALFTYPLVRIQQQKFQKDSVSAIAAAVAS